MGVVVPQASGGLVHKHLSPSHSPSPSPSPCRLFDPYTLEYMTTLPKPHHLGVRIGGFDLGEDVAEKGEGEEGKSSVGAEEAVKEYPDVVAVGIDTEQNRVSSMSDAVSLTCFFGRGHRPSLGAVPFV